MNEVEDLSVMNIPTDMPIAVDCNTACSDFSNWLFLLF